MNNRFAMETALYKRGIDYVIGVDEVGRGPLAGPVVAAAVSFKTPHASPLWEGITDSKRLSESKRILFSDFITTEAFSAVGLASVEEIEQLNILQASLVAMRRALANLKLDLSNSAILVDGKFLIPQLVCKEQRAVVKGDSLIHSIAAASIVAKVHRDAIMDDLSKQFPQYEFAKHKGYGTRAHIQSIKKYGLSPVHRVRFCGKIV